MKQHIKITYAERKLIALWHTHGLSNKEIARRLVRHPSAIGRELTRNTWYQTGQPIYEPIHAHAKAHERKEHAWRVKHPLKSPALYRYVIAHLLRGWSPEQIAGRAAHEAGMAMICHETIYQFIYKKDQSKRRWFDYLRRGHKKRRIKNGRKVQRVRIPDRVSIHLRPLKINARSEFGHWEGDTVVGQGHNHGVHTAYERLSSYYVIEPMEDMTSTSSIKAQLKLYSMLPQQARKSTTLDNGSEHVKHTTLKQALGMQTYFADPYSAWQRGGNENGNMWLRYYFPKGTDFREIAYKDIKAVQWELNNRPRKRLGYQTPEEVFTLNLKGCDR